MKSPLGLFLGVLGPLLAAGFAAYYGARLANKRYAREKAFDSRRQWYEDAVRSVIGFVESLQVLSGAAKHRIPSELNSSNVDTLNERLNRMLSILNLSKLYAKASGVEAVAILQGMLRAGLVPKPIDPSDRSKGYALSIEDIDKATMYARAVADELTVEFREHLGLEELPQLKISTKA
jgi:acyl-CoA synthetase (AMP-forming)/AMP-acid ligase II